MALDPRQATAAHVTSNQLRLLQVLACYWQGYGFSPSLRDLIRLLPCYSSTSVVAYNLQRLRSRGLVTFRPGTARTICLTEAGWAETGIAPPLAMASQA